MTQCLWRLDNCEDGYIILILLLLAIYLASFGSGKTRLSLDGLCRNWGLFIFVQDQGMSSIWFRRLQGSDRNVTIYEY